jgi:RNA polymerase-binding transcription factor DksA
MMTKADLETYRTVLRTLRARLTGNVSNLADEAFRAGGNNGSSGASVAPQHPADVGTDAFEQEFTLSLLENQEQVLEEIDAALERVRTGKFGRCEECATAIPKTRLQALPYARYCVTCARKLQ